MRASVFLVLPANAAAPLSAFLPCHQGWPQASAASFGRMYSCFFLHTGTAQEALECLHRMLYDVPGRCRAKGCECGCGYH